MKAAVCSPSKFRRGRPFFDHDTFQNFADHKGIPDGYADEDMEDIEQLSL